MAVGEYAMAWRLLTFDLSLFIAFFTVTPEDNPSGQSSRLDRKKFLPRLVVGSGPDRLITAYHSPIIMVTLEIFLCFFPFFLSSFSYLSFVGGILI